MTEQPEPVCKFPGGCHLVVECNPGCGAALPAVTEQPIRHTADTITDNDLDALYAELDQAKRDRNAVELGSHETISYWQSQATDARDYAYSRDRAHASTIIEARRQAARAEQAEAAIERVRKLADDWAILRAHGGAAYELRTALDESTGP